MSITSIEAIERSNGMGRAVLKEAEAKVVALPAAKAQVVSLPPAAAKPLSARLSPGSNPLWSTSCRRWSRSR